MDFVPLVSTIVGAMIGVGSTLLVDRGRWTRDQRVQEEHAQQQLHADFIAAVARSADIVWIVAMEDQPPSQDGNHRARSAFREADLYTWRYRLALVSPARAVEASEHLLDALRRYRDAVAGGHRPGSPPYDEARNDYFTAVGATINDLRGHHGRSHVSIRRSERRAMISARDSGRQDRASLNPP